MGNGLFKSSSSVCRVSLCESVYLSEAVVINEIRSVSVDQSVESETVLPAVRENR